MPQAGKLGRAVPHTSDARGFCAVRAAIEDTLVLDAVTDDAAPAMRADGSHYVNSALEAIESVMLPANDHFKRFVIFIFANFTCSHT